MHPIDQMSTVTQARASVQMMAALTIKNETVDSLPVVYRRKLSMISGARYHRVATYSVNGAPRSPPKPSGWNPRARPKSQILSYGFK